MSHWIIETLIATSLLMLAVLALRNPVARWFGPRIAYWLWLAPALRMVLPPLPAGWFGNADPLPAAPLVSDAAVMVTGSASPAPAMAGVAEAGVAWLTVSLAVWLGGALLFLGWHVLHYRRFAQGAMTTGAELDRGLPVRLLASPIVTSPVALGIFGRKVIVPEDFEFRYDVMEQRLALSHEVTHHRRGDLTVNFAALAMLALHWFNPIAHLAHRAFRLDQEAACDAIVLDGASHEERLAYGTALFKSATGQLPIATCAMGMNTTLKLRLRRIAQGDVTLRTARLGLATALAMVALGLGVTATRGIAAPDDAVLEDQAMIAAPQTRPEGASAPENQDDRVLAAVRQADWAQQQAEVARQKAEAVRDQAERLRDKAGNEATEAVIARAEAAADAARDAAEAAQEAVAEAAQDAEDSAKDMKDAADDVAKAAKDLSRTKHSLDQACKTAKSRQVMSQTINGRQIVIVQCDVAIAAFTNARTREALNDARKQIEGMAELSPLQKAAALKGLDQALSNFAMPAPPAAPAPPVPPMPRKSI